MADYQPVTEADLEPPAPPASGPPDGGGSAPANYETMSENDLAAPAGGPAGPTGEFAYKGIPAAAAARFGASNAMANIFGAGATRMVQGYANTFAALTAKDQQQMIDSGYKPGDFNSVGGALRWGADVFTAGLSTIEDGFLAIPSAITEGAAGVAEQFAREAGSPVPESVGREFGGAAEAALSDVGAMGELSRIDAAKAQAAVPGVYANAYRVDPTPGGGLVHTPLGRLPADGAEAMADAQTAADALHLPPETAGLIHKTYVQTGRPPAEVLMDAKTNAGGVLDDLVAGKVPTVYQGTPRAMTPEELGAAKPPVQPPDLTQIPGTIEQAEKLPMAGDNLGGLNVTGNVPNTSSISASLGDDYTEVGGIRAIPMSEFPGAGKGYVSASDTQRVADLAQQIKANGHIDPLIVVMDKDGPYVLEGGHRLDALKSLGQQDVPAMVIVDHSNEHPAATAVYANIEQQRAADQAAFLKERGMTQAEVSALPAAGKKEINTAFQKWRADKAAKPATEPSAAPTGISKIGQSIEAKAVEDGLTKGFGQTAGYDKLTIEDQANRATSLINDNLDQARAVIRGEQPLPDGLRGTALITGMEEYIKKNPDADLAYELANSPLVSATSSAAQEMRLAAERTPDSATAKIQELRDAEVKQAGGTAEVTARQKAVKRALPEASGVLLPKEELSWERFLQAIKC